MSRDPDHRTADIQIRIAVMNRAPALGGAGIRGIARRAAGQDTISRNDASRNNTQEASASLVQLRCQFTNWFANTTFSMLHRQDFSPDRHGMSHAARLWSGGVMATARGLLSDATWAFFDPFVRGTRARNGRRGPTTGGCSTGCVSDRAGGLPSARPARGVRQMVERLTPVPPLDAGRAVGN